MSKKLTTPALTTASLAALLSANSAHALIITNTDLSEPSFTGGDSVQADWNIDGAGSSEVSFDGYKSVSTSTTSGMVLPYFYGSLNASNAQNGFGFAVYPGNQYLTNLSLGATVSSGASFKGSINSIMNEYGFWQASGFTSGEEGYIGFQFTPESTTLYGWARVNLDTTNNSISILEWAYDDSGNSIQVGQTQVPEPAETAVGLGALALGAAGLRRWRKNRKAA